MIIFREKYFGLVDKISSFFKKSSNKLKGNDDSNEVTISDLSKTTDIKIDDIKFSELVEKDYYPALITLGIKDVDDGTPDHSWGKFNSWMKSVGMISNGDLIAVHVISDNVKGEDGLSVNLLEFSPKTKISSSTRLYYSNNFKWPEDFINNCSSWYKSGQK